MRQLAEEEARRVREVADARRKSKAVVGALQVGALTSRLGTGGGVSFVITVFKQRWVWLASWCHPAYCTVHPFSCVIVNEGLGVK